MLNLKQDNIIMEITKSFLAINAVVNKANSMELPGYLKQMMKIFEDSGGTPIARYKVVENIAGDRAPEMIAIISFPDAQTIKDMIEGEGYKALGEKRSRIFEHLDLVICAGL